MESVAVAVAVRNGAIARLLARRFLPALRTKGWVHAHASHAARARRGTDEKRTPSDAVVPSGANLPKVYDVEGDAGQSARLSPDPAGQVQ